MLVFLMLHEKLEVFQESVSHRAKLVLSNISLFSTIITGRGPQQAVSAQRDIVWLLAKFPKSSSLAQFPKLSTLDLLSSLISVSSYSHPVSFALPELQHLAHNRPRSPPRSSLAKPHLCLRRYANLPILNRSRLLQRSDTSARVRQS